VSWPEGRAARPGVTLGIKSSRGDNVMGISVWQLLIILAIVLVLFGAKQ